MTEKEEQERIKQMKEDEEQENASEEKEEERDGKNLEERGVSCMCVYVQKCRQEVEEESSVYRHTHHGAPAAY